MTDQKNQPPSEGPVGPRRQDAVPATDKPGDAPAFVVKSCNGPQGCPNAIGKENELAGEITGVFDRLGFFGFLKANLTGPIRAHHQLKVVISYCPNACSQPQIADLGIILADPVRVTGNPCSFCRACVKACLEEAIVLDPGSGPVIDPARCLYCGKCGRICPTQAIEGGCGPQYPPGGSQGGGESAFRFLAGGKLGRHPRLATEFPGLFSKTQVMAMIERTLKIFMENFPKAKRVADLFALFDQQELLGKIRCG